MARITTVILTYILTFIIILKITDCQQTSYVIYGNGATSERNLPDCETQTTACSIVYHRFWLSNMVVRLCKCLDRSECPFNWAMNDKYTMNFNNRAQLKFCSKVRNLHKCNTTEVALKVHNRKSNITKFSLSINVFCYCSQMHFYKFSYSNESEHEPGILTQKNYYSCLTKKNCLSREFCGHITVDKYEIYKVCRCPENHICVMENRQTTQVVEPLYEALAYKGLCISSNNE